jgi:hypothetical protein
LKVYLWGIGRNYVSGLLLKKNNDKKVKILIQMIKNQVVFRTTIITSLKESQSCPEIRTEMFSRPKGESKMNNADKLATPDTQYEEKQHNTCRTSPHANTNNVNKT